MTLHTEPIALPAITIGEDDFQLLKKQAEQAGGFLAEAGEQLLEELSRATLRPQAELPADTVRLGDWVTFRTARGTRRLKLVLPDEADITEGRLSVLTPVGAALIGLSQGQSIAFEAPSGEVERLIVTTVER
ncbi:GreA/GreB family elongation factor [Asticcacaulis sp. AND118]|uniref:GreA/GreB family elongation factor n=1 Tax=Asticcacaulis sp. AND118 TaxID=2840468 RepID=UPI001CFFBCB4|nr:GreA/GreB family elongation factor [Asticcacaulis sp. AND118]UDF03724.1 GreA/GreB family elongation factor [Asticcacaulis sp. AND118]